MFSTYELCKRVYYYIFLKIVAYMVIDVLYPERYYENK